MGDVVGADQDHREVRRQVQGELPLRYQTVRGGSDHRDAAQLDRPVQPLGEPGREQRSGGVAGPLDPVPGRRGVAHDDQADRVAVVLDAVPAVTARRRGLGQPDRVAGQPGLPEQEHHRQYAGQAEPAATECGGGGNPVSPAHGHESPIGNVI